MLNTLKTLSLAVLLGSGPVQAADAPLKIGTAAFAPPLEVAVSEAGKQGLKVELVEFSDWNAPNITLAQGDIDANYFQHVPFLENANREGGFQLKPFAPGIINNVGLYSKRYASLAELPEGASVAIANDPINGGRGLQLLQKAGLLKLRDGVGYRRPSTISSTTRRTSASPSWRRCNWRAPSTISTWPRATRTTCAWPGPSTRPGRCCSTGSTTGNT